MISSALILRLFSNHIGEHFGATAKALVQEFRTRFQTKITERDLRHAVHALRLDGHHICGHPSTGYFLAANAEELERTCHFMAVRAFSSLQQVSKMRKVSIPDLIGQARIAYETTK